MKADRKGVTAMEYGVIAAGIVIAVAAAATTVGNDISGSLHLYWWVALTAGNARKAPLNND